MKPDNRWFNTWLTGLFEYLMSDIESFGALVYANAKFAGESALIGMDQVEPLSRHILTGAMRDTILNGTWAYMPGLNPNGNTGCAFLTDIFTKWFLGVDPCDGSKFRSL